MNGGTWTKSPATASAAAVPVAGLTALQALRDAVQVILRFALKPMSPEEAALQMDMLGHAFFVFRDAESDQVSVVYRRRDGQYGLLQPQLG